MRALLEHTRIMAQSQKLALPGLAMAVLLLATVCGASEQVSSGKLDLLTGHSTPMLSSLAHQFFSLAAQQSAVNNGSQQLVVPSSSQDRAYNDDLCDRDVTRIRDAINNMEEWALECKPPFYWFTNIFSYWGYSQFGFFVFFFFCQVLWHSVNQFRIKSDKSRAIVKSAIW